MKDESQDLCRQCGKRTDYRCDLCHRSLCYRHCRHPRRLIPETTQRTLKRSDLCVTCAEWAAEQETHPRPLPRWVRAWLPGAISGSDDNRWN